MWLANFENGTAVTSKEAFWTQLPKDKKLTGIQLTHNHFPNLHLNIANLDKYFFIKEEIVMFSSGSAGSPTVVAEIIGGIDEECGVVTELRLDYTGSIKNKLYPLSRFRYSKECLRDGVRKKVD